MPAPLPFPAAVLRVITHPPPPPLASGQDDVFGSTGSGVTLADVVHEWEESNPGAVEEEAAEAIRRAERDRVARIVRPRPSVTLIVLTIVPPRAPDRAVPASTRARALAAPCSREGQFLRRVSGHRPGHSGASWGSAAAHHRTGPTLGGMRLRAPLRPYTHARRDWVMPGRRGAVGDVSCVLSDSALSLSHIHVRAGRLHSAAVPPRDALHAGAAKRRPDPHGVRRHARCEALCTRSLPPTNGYSTPPRRPHTLPQT